MRLFIAVLLPEEIKNELCRRRDMILKYAEKGTGTKRENFHLTLAFLGEISGIGNIQKIKGAMDRVEESSFSFFLGGIDKFSNNGESIYWTQVRPCQSLWNVQRNLESFLREEGFSLEKRKFKPHLTLTRRTVLPLEQDRMLRQRRFPEMEVPVKEICLMKSERVDGKPIYTKLYEKNF